MKNTMKKLLAATLVLFVALGCTACTDDMTSYVKLGAEISALSQVQQTGTIKLDLDLNTDYENGWAGDFTNVEFAFKANADNKNLQMKLAGELTLGKTTLPLTIYLDQTKLYFNTGELIALYQLVDSENTDGLHQLTTAFGDAEWLCVDALDADSWELYQELIGDESVQNSFEQFYTEAANLMTALKEPYAAFNGSLLTKKGNSYTWSLDNNKVAKFSNDFVQYSVKNAEKIGSVLAGWVDASVLISDEYKAELKSAIYAGISYAQTLTKENLLDLEKTIKYGVDSWPFDCSLDYSVTRKSAKSFEVDFTLDYKDLYGTDYVNGLKMTGNATTTGVSNLKIAIPTQNMLNVADIDRSGFAPTAVSATIYLDEDYMFYQHYYALSMLDDSGVVTPDVRIINNTTYLGLRPVAEACGEEVGWDNARKRAYVVRDGEPVYVTGYVDTTTGRSYLKIRDFEKLGYTVTYEKSDWGWQNVYLKR